MKAKNVYKLPVDKENFVEANRTRSPVHVGKLIHAVDFLFTTERGDYSINDIPIKAARGGKVVYVKNDSDRGGPDMKYWEDGNGIMLKHENDEFSYYEHFRHQGIEVNKGELVKTGELLGYSGKTGYTFLSHLHFDVRRFTGPGRKDFETLEVHFNDLED